MKSYKCIIVDDEAVAQRIIVRHLENLGGVEVLATCFNAMEARTFLQEQSVDLMFLDIEMPRLKGLDFLKTLAEAPQVIITTAHREFALEGYELEVLDYLLKPISFERFVKAMNRFQQRMELVPTAKNEVIYLKSERKTIKLSIAAITFIEGMNNYIIVHANAQKYIVYDSLTNIQKQLGNDFLRIHKSYLINKNHIAAFSKEQVEIGDKALPIGKAYKEIISRF